MKNHCGPGPRRARVLPAELKHQFEVVCGVLAHVLPQIAHDTSRPKKMNYLDGNDLCFNK